MQLNCFFSFLFIPRCFTIFTMLDSKYFKCWRIFCFIYLYTFFVAFLLT